MKTGVTVARMLVRVCGVVLIVLGLLFWFGDAPRGLVPVHILLGIVLVLALWALAFLGARVGVNRGLVAAAVVWGLLTVWLGQAQDALLPDPSVHWVVQVLHLIVGMGAIGLGEAIGGQATRIETGQAPAHA
jgi:hypothetical protein